MLRLTADRTFTVVALSAIVILAGAAGRLVAIDGSLFQSWQAQKKINETIPRLGSLGGFNALNDSEWTMGEGGTATIYTVLFPVRATDSASDVALWREVATSSAGAFPNLQFVGVCENPTRCIEPSVGDSIGLVSHMDLDQMHSLALATASGTALLYRGHALITPIRQHDDALRLSIEIADQVNLATAALAAEFERFIDAEFDQ